MAASLVGLEAQALGPKLTEFGDEELSGARQLIEKIVSFGGEPATQVANLEFHDGGRGRARLVEPTGREGRSEALEHMLEHQIMRKQHQVDFLERAAGS